MKQENPPHLICRKLLHLKTIMCFEKQATNVDNEVDKHQESSTIVVIKKLIDIQL